MCQVGERCDRSVNESEPAESVNVRITPLFDATRNNERNTQVRLKAVRDLSARAILNEHSQKPHTGYASDYSSVARLRQTLKGTDAGYDYYFRIYTEEVGTTDEQTDSFWGYFGRSGETGIPIRVSQGIAVALRQLTTIRGVERKRMSRPVAEAPAPPRRRSARAVGLAAALACRADSRSSASPPPGGQGRTDEPRSAVTRAERFEWLAGASAPRGCPMSLASGEFRLTGGGALGLQPEAQINGGWGAQLAADVIGDAQKPAPDRLDVLFYSYQEDKFYHGAFPLPRDSIPKLLREGYPSPRGGGRGTYDFLTVGIAPGGAVAVWASGADRQTEVFFGQAQPEDLDWHVALDMPAEVDRRESVQRVLAGAADSDSLVRRMTARLPVGRWAQYRTRYRWRLALEGIGAPVRPGAVHFVNGERDVLTVPDPASERQGRPVPEYLEFDDPQGGVSYDVKFEDEEATAAFTRVGAEGRPVDLVISDQAGGSGAGPTVRVRSSAGDVALSRATVRVVRRR